MSHLDEQDEHACKNFSDNPSIESMLDINLTRRKVMAGGIAAATTVIGFGLAGCNDENTAELPGVITSPTAPPSPTPTPVAPKLGFAAVPKRLTDVVSVPAGYTASVLYRTGDPLNNATAAYRNDGTDTGDSFDFRAGEHHDGMYFFGLGSNGKFDPTVSNRALLVMNHENISSATQFYMHRNGPTTNGQTGAALVRTVADEVIKEVNMHGVSVVELARNAAGVWSYVQGSSFNRRITAATEMDLTGPAAGSSKLATAFSTTGVKTRGTINNCANGFTPWGTYLTCEENHAGYFRRNSGDNANRTANEIVAFNRYGIAEGATGNYQWATATVPSGKPADLFSRWNATKASATAAATGDFQNAMNTFGWVVEIDPFAPSSTPAKRTALGRMAHEGAWPGPVVVGKPVVFYMGDDSRGEYLFKFVSDANWVASDANGGLAAGAKYLNVGKLYVAKFTASGAGEWLLLSKATIPASYTTYTFADEADVLIHSRLAADAVGATKMDRPEWTAVNPNNGEVYLTLTNNSGRTVATTDFANPRSYNDPKGSAGTAQRGNPNGHIIRLREAGDNPAATSFSWDNYLFGARSTADAANVNLSGLTANNDLSSPDGLWFAKSGLLWIETDDGAYTDVTNCMLLAALPGRVSDGGKVTITNTDGTTTRTQETPVGAKATEATLLRFLVGPAGAEITGLTESHDGKALFLNIQHPGEDMLSGFNVNDPSTYQSGWPHAADAQAAPASPRARPRSATVVVTKNDGGVIGL